MAASTPPIHAFQEVLVAALLSAADIVVDSLLTLHTQAVVKRSTRMCVSMTFVPSVVGASFTVTC